MCAIEIAGRNIGPGRPCFVIAEAGVNHNGDLDLAKRLVIAAAQAGADAVKFQLFKIGGSWIKGLPVKSTYHFKLLLRLCESGFYLAQDFYHYNPARLPTPAEWVTVRRLRVKDAVNNVFWLVRDPFVEADNRKVLDRYSDSMQNLLKNGYKAKLRPSGHDITEESASYDEEYSDWSGNPRGAGRV